MTATPPHELSDEQIDAIARDGYYIDATGEPQSLFAVGRMVVKSLCAQAKAYTALRAQLAAAGAEIEEPMRSVLVERVREFCRSIIAGLQPCDYGKRSAMEGRLSAEAEQLLEELALEPAVSEEAADALERLSRENAEFKSLAADLIRDVPISASAVEVIKRELYLREQRADLAESRLAAARDELGNIVRAELQKRGNV